MRKILPFIFIIFFSFNLFSQNLSFEDLKNSYENLLTFSTLESLRNFSTSLDLYSLSNEYSSLKKHKVYLTAFTQLNDTTKQLLSTFENPWNDDSAASTEIFSTRLIDEKFYYFLTAHNNYVTRNMIFYKVFFTILCALIVIIFTVIVTFSNLKKEKQKKMIFTQAMLAGQENERKRISQELHDTIAQNLKVQKFQILNAIEKNKDGLNIKEDLTEIFEKSKTNITEIRSICQNLFPPDFENQKLDWIIAELCENVKKNSKINCTYFIDSESPFADSEKEHKLNLFRIIQEVVNNAVLHSDCTAIQIYITKKELIISDNGKGFDYNKKLKEAEKNKHFGLRSIKERALMLKLTLEIKSNENGTRVYLKCKN